MCHSVPAEPPRASSEEGGLWGDPAWSSSFPGLLCTLSFMGNFAFGRIKKLLFPFSLTSLPGDPNGAMCERHL